MNCLDCADTFASERPAVAICHDCGSAACREHAIVRVRHLTATGAIGRVLTVERTGRIIRCATCDAAETSRAATRH